MTLTEEELVPKYDTDGDEVAYEEFEVIEHDHGESLVIQQVMNVAVSQSIDDDSWLRNNIFRTKCTAKGKVCSSLIMEVVRIWFQSTWCRNSGRRRKIAQNPTNLLG